MEPVTLDDPPLYLAPSSPNAVVTAAPAATFESSVADHIRRILVVESGAELDPAPKVGKLIGAVGMRAPVVSVFVSVSRGTCLG